MNPPTETLDLGDGYSADIDYDLSPENPFDRYGNEPALLSFNDRLLDRHDGDTLCVDYFLTRIPVGRFRYAKFRDRLYAALHIEAVDVEYWMSDVARTPDNWLDAIREVNGRYSDLEKPHYWSDAETYFDALAELCDITGITCHQGISRGYSQGHASLVLVVATPEWVAAVGAPQKSLAAQCQGAFDLFTAWAWGDCYGVSTITDPHGDEIPNASCWGYYGSDHEKSGLLDFCREMKTYHERYLQREAAESFAMACRDIITA